MEKVNIVIDIIKDMYIKDKLRLGLLILESGFTSLVYDKKELYNYFDELLKTNDEKYKTTFVNFNKYNIVNFTMAKLIEMNSEEQNRVLLFWIDNIERNINNKTYHKRTLIFQ